MYGDSDYDRKQDSDYGREPSAKEGDAPAQSGEYNDSPSPEARPGMNYDSGTDYDTSSPSGRFSGSYRGREYSGGYGSYGAPGGYGGYGNQGGYGRYNPDREPGIGPASMKGKGKKPGFFPRAIAAIFLGLFFGAFAAAGFFGVRSLMESAGFITNQGIGGASGQTATSATDTVGDQALPQSALRNAQDEATPTQTTYSAVVTDVSNVVESAMPSMVSITNKFTDRTNFFGQTFEREGSSGGTGIIIGENDSEYLLVTNQHVISGAEDLLVKFIDGEEVSAYVKGYDSDVDIAVIAVDKGDVKPATQSKISIAVMGDSGHLVLGEPTIAIGNALGYGQSVTTGVVSALDREIGGEGDSTYIQTDAAINPGNSGGALLNMKGEVIGINSIKLGGSVIEGIGYAIPISRVKTLIEDFMQITATGKKVETGKQAYIGITGVDVTTDVSRTYNMPEGVYIAQVHEGSAASKAGLVTGDIIVKFNGSSVKTMAELQEMLSHYEAGTTVNIIISRGFAGGFEEKTVSVTLGNRDDMKE